MPGNFNLDIDMYEWEIIDTIPSNDDCSTRTNKQRWVRLAAARAFCHSRHCGLGLAAWPGLQLLNLGLRVWGLNKQLGEVPALPCPALSRPHLFSQFAAILQRGWAAKQSGVLCVAQPRPGSLGRAAQPGSWTSHRHRGASG